jgi:hypothetical protein
MTINMWREWLKNEFHVINGLQTSLKILRDMDRSSWTTGRSGLTRLGSIDDNDGKQTVQGFSMATVNDEFNNLGNAQIA